VVIVGALAGIAAYDAESGAEVETILTGVHLLPKATGQIDAGALVYWSTSTKNCTTTGTDVLIGAAVELAIVGGRGQGQAQWRCYRLN
jgi:predicted RecA/RadA family phage recombinase